MFMHFNPSIYASIKAYYNEHKEIIGINIVHFYNTFCLCSNI
jgi:hypothetical protein